MHPEPSYAEQAQRHHQTAEARDRVRARILVVLLSALLGKEVVVALAEATPGRGALAVPRAFLEHQVCGVFFAYHVHNLHDPMGLVRAAD